MMQRIDNYLRTRAFGVARILLAALFIYSGIGIIQAGIGPTAAYYESVGVPVAMLAVWIVLALKIIGGGMFMLGIYVRETGMALIAFTALTIFFAHASLESTDFWKNLSIIGGLMAALAYDVHARDYAKSQEEVRVG